LSLTRRRNSSRPSRLAPFRTRSPRSQILCRSALHPRTADVDHRHCKIIRNGAPLVLDLSDLGDEPAALLGAIVINQVKQAAETVREPYDLYIDEFQNFGTSIISTILSESGKFGLNLTLAHQFISQLEPEIRDAVLGNCNTIVSFRVGAEDAPIIAKALGCEPQGLKDLPRGRALYRTLFDGHPTEPRSMKTEKVELPTGRLATNIRTTNANCARPRRLVDQLMRAKPRKPSSSW
jgi:TraM recognition site of TraD and TraG